MYYVCEYCSNDMFDISVYAENPVENLNAKPTTVIQIPTFVIQYICETSPTYHRAPKTDDEMGQYIYTHCFNQGNFVK